MMRNATRLIVVWLCLAAGASARDIFVSNVAGDDRREGRAPTASVPKLGPVRSISKALRLAGAGDRIVVANTGQPYRETLSLSGSRHSGSLVGPLVIEGGGATLDGSVLIPATQWQHVADDVYAYQPARLGYQQLFVDDHPAVRRPARRDASGPPPLEPREWCFWHGRIYFRVNAGKMPDAYALACCGLQTGITLYYVHDVLIRDLAVRGFQLDGVAVHDVVQATRLERITASANGACGVSARGASLVELDQCQLAGNGAAQLRVADFAHVWLYACELLADTAPAIERMGGRVTIEPEPFAPPDL